MRGMQAGCCYYARKLSLWVKSSRTRLKAKEPILGKFSVLHMPDFAERGISATIL